VTGSPESASASESSAPQRTILDHMIHAGRSRRTTDSISVPRVTDTGLFHYELLLVSAARADTHPVRPSDPG